MFKGVLKGTSPPNVSTWRFKNLPFKGSFKGPFKGFYRDSIRV